MNKNDALVSKNGNFSCSCSFADAYLFVNPERAQNYIDQNNLKKIILQWLRLFNI